MGTLIQRTREAFERGKNFVLYGVWQIGMPGEDIPKGFIIKQVRVAILLGSKLLDGMHMVRASSLAFATILSIVPFLAVTFFIIETFNLGEDLYALVQDRLEVAVEDLSDTLTVDEPPADADLVSDEVAGSVETPPESESVVSDAGSPSEPADAIPISEERGPPESDESGEDEIADEALDEEATDVAQTKSEELQEEIVRSLFQGVAQQRDDMQDPVREIVDMVSGLAHDAATNRTALTLSGLLLVLTTVFGLMRNIENTFNRIWGVRRTRSWYRMASDYVIITLLLPFVAAVVLGVTAAMHSEQIVSALGPLAFGLQFSQHVVIVLVFGLLYKFVPNTRVEFRYAFLAGFIAASMWILLSLGYVRFQFGLARYAVVLSAFAQIPMLLTWIYLSWAILLLGCELAYAYQNESTFALERFADDASYAYREAVGLRAMLEVGRRFSEGREGLELEKAAQEWNVPVRLLRDAVESLVEAGYISTRATEPVSYQPARPLDKIRAGDVIGILRDAGEEPSLFRKDDRFKSIFEELARHEDDFGGASISDLIAGLDEVEVSNAPTESLNA